MTSRSNLEKNIGSISSFSIIRYCAPSSLDTSTSACSLVVGSSISVRHSPDCRERSSRAMISNHSTQQIAAQIADQLGEAHVQARQKIEQIVEACGSEQALAWLEETLAIETNGGLMVNNGERRRAPGGVYFYL